MTQKDKLNTVLKNAYKSYLENKQRGYYDVVELLAESGIESNYEEAHVLGCRLRDQNLVNFLGAFGNTGNPHVELKSEGIEYCEEMEPLKSTVKTNRYATVVQAPPNANNFDSIDWSKYRKPVSAPPNQNYTMIKDPQYKSECNAVLQYLLDGNNTNNGIWYYQNVTKEFSDIPIRVLDNVIFPKLKADGYITVINGMDAPSSTKTRVQFKLNDKGRLFIANGGYTVSKPKGMKDFIFELLVLLDESGTTTDVADFVVDFQQANGLDRATVGLEIDKLMRDKLVSSFGHEFLTVSGGQVNYERPYIRASITQAGQTYLDRMKEQRDKRDTNGASHLPNKTHKQTVIETSKVFIVHGHDNEAKTEVARYIENLGLEAIILHEQASGGKTIIEKIENYTNVGFGIVLYTPCDEGAKLGSGDAFQPRARQNVLLEHGYLMGKLGRNKVCALVKGNVETPSDISGIVYIEMDDRRAWHRDIAKEMTAAGYLIDAARLLRL